MQDVKSVEYQGRCYVPTGDTIKLSQVSITDIEQTQPYYGSCGTCRTGETVLSTTSTTPITSSTTQLELETSQIDDTFVMSLTAGDQTIDYLAMRIDTTGLVVYASNSTGDPVGPVSTLGIKDNISVTLASRGNITVSQPVVGVYVLYKSIQITFTTHVVRDPSNPTQFAAPYQQLSTRITSDPYTSIRYELKINDTVQDVNATGVFSFITTGDNNVDTIDVIGYDTNDQITTSSNSLIIRTDNVLANAPVEHGGEYYGSTSDTYNFSTTDLGNNNLDLIRTRLGGYGFNLNRVVRVQDFISNHMLWQEIGTSNIIGKVVSNYNNIADRYSYQNKCIFLTNSPTSDSVNIYHENTVLNCKQSTSSHCSKLNGYYLASHGQLKPVLVSFTT